MEAVELAPGAFAVIGSRNEASVANRGEVGNHGIIVGESGVLMINTGTSYAQGRRLLEIARRVTDKPVVMAVITQPLPEFILGAAVFADRGIPVLAHDDAARLLAQRCEQCLERLRMLLGADLMAGSRVVTPDRVIRDGQVIDLGRRQVELIVPGWASAPGDLMLRDRATGVLFSGALVTEQRIPDIRDARLDAWLGVLDELSRERDTVVVPGYGEPLCASAIALQRDYLHALQAWVDAQLEAGASLHETTRDAIVAPAFTPYRNWAGFTTIHPRNVHRYYLQREARPFGQ